MTNTESLLFWSEFRIAPKQNSSFDFFARKSFNSGLKSDFIESPLLILSVKSKIQSEINSYLHLHLKKSLENKIKSIPKD